MAERFELLHKTTYDFAEWVPRCELEARLRPRPRPGLACLSHFISVIPLAQNREAVSDRFGNPVEKFTVRRSLRRLVISASTTIELGPEWPQPAAKAEDALEPSLSSPESALTPDDAMRKACFDYAAPALLSTGSRLDGVAVLARQINRDMIYDPRIVDVGRPVDLLLRERRGIGQDYTRLAIAALRAHHIPARWVVGYVLPGTRRNPTRHGSYHWIHAWFSAFTPDRGWVDFDATQPAGEAGDLLTLGWGADETEVAPLRGKLAVDVSQQKVGVEITIDRLG